MADLTATFEAGVNGNTIAAGDTGSLTQWDAVTDGAGNTTTYSNTHAAHGSLSAKFDNNALPSSFCNCDWSTALGTVTDHYGRFYIYMTAYPADHYRIIDMANTGAFACRLRIEVNGHIQLANNTGATTGSIAAALNQWVRIEYHFIHSATVGQQEAKLFNTMDSTSADETITTPANRNTLASANTIKIGLIGGGSAGTIWLDDIVANATSYPGPASVALVNSVAPSLSGALNVGGTLTINPGTWTPTPGSFTYYWHKADDASGTNLVEIGATGATYTLDSADTGKYIRAGVIPHT